MILCGSATQALGAALGDAIDEPVLPLSYRRFQDGELIVEVAGSQPLPDGVTLEAGTFAIDGRAVVLASTVDDRAHLEALQLQDLAREGGASSVVTVIPYLGYARQDVAHAPGQPVSARAIARAVSAGTDAVITVDPHERAVLEYFSVEATAVSAVGALADGLSVEAEPLIVAPDAGARSLAADLARALGTGSVTHLEKDRIDDTTVEIDLGGTDASGREVILVDDEIATGGTMATATERLLETGATSVRVACVHPLLVGGALTRLHAAGIDRIVATDTIERPVSCVSAAGAIASAL